MKELNRLQQIGANLLLILIFVFVGIQKSNAQTADDFCNCPEGAFPTLVPPQAVKNGVILASDLFRFLRLPQNPPVTKRCLIIDRPLIFNEPWERRMIQCHLSMKPGSSIHILPTSGGLHYRGGSIRGCSAPWNGITTSEGVNLNLEATIISGASTAVKVEDNVKLQLRGCTFEDNFFGVEIADSVTTTGVPIFGCSFKNCLIGINNKGNLIVGAEFSPNLFDSCNTAILSVNGNLFLSNTTIQNCNTGIVTENNESAEIIGITFSKCQSGVRDINSNINIENNNFDKIKFDAIDLNGHLLRSIEVRGNTINSWDGLAASNVFSENFIVTENKFSASGPLLSAISLNNVNARNGKIEHNTIKNEEPISVADGILVTSSTGLIISNNTIESNASAAVGMEIVGTSQMTISENTILGGNTNVGIVIENSQIDLHCNQIIDHLNGIVVKGFSKSNIATNTISGGTIGILLDHNAITGPQIHNGNLWLGNFTAADAYHYNFDKAFYSLSSFFVNDATDNAFPSKAYPDTWFEKRNGTTATCSAGKSARATLNEDFDIKLLSQEIYTDADNRALNFEATRYLLESEIASKTETNLLAKVENQNIKPLNEVRDGIINMFDYGTPAMMNYKNLQNELTVLFEELIVLKNHSAETNFDSNEEQSDLNIKLKTLLQKIKSLRSSLRTTLTNQATTLKKRLGSIKTNRTFELNEVFVQNLHLKILSDGIDAVSNEEKIQLATIAAANPSTDGMAVYKAKGLLYETIEVETPSTTIETLNNSEPQTFKNTATNDLEIEIFPNPTSEFLNIRTPLTNNAFEICNLTGQLMKSGKLTNNSIRISEFPEGFYVLRVLENDQLIAAEKFSVIK